MVRIVHVSDFYLPRLGGIELQIAGLVTHQRAAGHDVRVLTATAAGGTEAGPAAVIRTGRAGQAGILPRHARPALVTADVAHVHLGGVSPLGWAVLGERGAAGLPTVATVHSVLDRMQVLHRALRGLGHWRSAPVVWSAVSQHVADQMRELLGPRAVVCVVPNAVDQDRWTPAADGRATGAATQPPDGPAEVLVVAALRHTRRKRAEALPDILAHAARLVPAQAAQHGIPEPRLRAVIAGTGTRTPALRRAVTAAGLDRWVDLPGRLTHEELRALYHRADVFVAPTVLESFGLAALEARAAGLPVVARADSGSGEVLDAGREALLVESDDEMAGALARLVTDHGLRRRIAEHNRRTRIAFDWPGTIALTERAYATACRLTGSTAALPPEAALRAARPA